MPKIVDHGKRREELLEAVTRVIARSGIDGATMRAIADESGWSTGSLAHYFSDRDDILASALRYSHRVIRERWARKLEGLAGLAALRELVLDNLPLDAERTSETRLEIIFWGQALNAPFLMEVQQSEETDLFRTMRELVVDAQVAGEVERRLNPDLVAERLLALIDGLSLHRLLYGSRLSTSAMTKIIDQEFEALSPSSGD
ncbi:TetR family transcriptional regulator C-terminal domain-containing protein [Dactylosporangium fulvum]|uniref:TetR family transcriptional regulator n=1 Tax=Dactylosporangium fulvum TaxID=53359 RepID=A0ABY5VQH3_9ACTN|nr:TetR/AcrR family transcriptional regulator [Dactylosporangium fulvum]UWP79780.1 TetR family transcriptional regulator [Dactylosporangium fulvum]